MLEPSEPPLATTLLKNLKRKHIYLLIMILMFLIYLITLPLYSSPAVSVEFEETKVAIDEGGSASVYVTLGSGFEISANTLDLTAHFVMGGYTCIL